MPATASTKIGVCPSSFPGCTFSSDNITLDEAYGGKNLLGESWPDIVAGMNEEEDTERADGYWDHIAQNHLTASARQAIQASYVQRHADEGFFPPDLTGPINELLVRVGETLSTGVALGKEESEVLTGVEDAVLAPSREYDADHLEQIAANHPELYADYVMGSVREALTRFDHEGRPVLRRIFCLLSDDGDGEEAWERYQQMRALKEAIDSTWGPDRRTLYCVDF